MSSSLESLIKLAYASWRREESPNLKTPHPSPELLVAFLEKPLPAEESKKIKLHIIFCDYCCEILTAQLAIGIKLTPEAPQGLIKWAKELPVHRSNAFRFAKIIQLKTKFFTKLSTQKFIVVLSLLSRHLRAVGLHLR